MELDYMELDWLKKGMWNLKHAEVEKAEQNGFSEKYTIPLHQKIDKILEKLQKEQDSISYLKTSL